MSTGFSDRVLTWYRQHGRHDLPWQQEINPYRVWISEVMLQQTQVATVIPYFEKFVNRFPAVESLATADIDEVLHLWSGLGYYARARNLHRAAEIICEQHDGQMPDNFDQVLALPGIGRSTAGAILALSMNQRHAILDGNVKRVLARHSAIAGWPGEKKVAENLWAIAEANTPQTKVPDYTQAIMDLGATLCTRSKPACVACPVNADCCAYLAGTVQDFPGKKPRRARRLKKTTMMLAVSGNAVLLQQRPPSGIWGGLWGLPELDATDTPIQWCQQHLGCEPGTFEDWPVLQHSFTHFDLEITPVVAHLARKPAVVSSEKQLWYNTAKPAAVGLAAPVAVLLKQLRP